MRKQRMLRVILIVGCTTALALAAAVMGSERPEVLLRYQWNAGEQQWYAVSGRMQGTMVMSGAPGQAQEADVELPITTEFDVACTALTRAVDDQGNGTVELQLSPMLISTDAAGQHMDMTIPFTKGTMLVNGKEQPLPWVSAQQSAQPTTMKLSPRGKLLQITGLERMMPMMGPTFLGHMDLNSLLPLSQVQFPEEALAVGQQWEQLTPLAPFFTSESQQDVQMQTIKYTLQALRTVEGHPVAQIGMESVLQLENFTMPMPLGEQAQGLSLSMTFVYLNVAQEGSLRFDCEAGQLINAAWETTTNAKMNIRMEGEVEGQEQSVNVEREMRDFATHLEIELQE